MSRYQVGNVINIAISFGLLTEFDQGLYWTFWMSDEGFHGRKSKSEGFGKVVAVCHMFFPTLILKKNGCTTQSE